MIGRDGVRNPAAPPQGVAGRAGACAPAAHDADIRDVTAVVPANESAFPEVLTVPELAALLRLKTKSLYALLSRDRDAIPGCRKVGGAWRAHRATVVAWLAGQNSDARQRTRGVR